MGSPLRRPWPARLPTRGTWSAVLRPVRRGGRVVVAVLAVAVVWPGLPGLSSGIARGAAIGVLAIVFLLLIRPAKQPVERQVEPPNSHFNPPGVSHGPIATPWDSIDLEALHEVNRSVVEVLLARARELGPSHLSEGERELLDRMAFASKLARGGGGAGRGPAT